MSYNTDRRKPLTKKQRATFLAAHDHRCHWCHQLITDDLWDDEHIVPRELLPPGSGADDMSNRAPIHRDPCHKQKTKRDRAMIAKSNRIRRANGPLELRKQKQKINSRPFGKGHRPLQSLAISKETRMMTVTCKLAGLSYRSPSERETAMRLREGAQLWLQREPDNQYDANAVQVKTGPDDGAILIGYLPREHAAEIARAMDAGTLFECFVSTPQIRHEAPIIAIREEIAF